MYGWAKARSARCFSPGVCRDRSYRTSSLGCPRVRVVHAAQRHSAFVAFSCTIILARPQDLAMGPKCQVVFWVVFELELGPGRIRGESKRSLSQFMRMYLLCASLDDLRGARC